MCDYRLSGIKEDNLEQSKPAHHVLDSYVGQRVASGDKCTNQSCIQLEHTGQNADILSARSGLDMKQVHMLES